MTASNVYDLHWKSIPLGAIRRYDGWYDPYVGRGVYMLVLATADNNYVGYYIGKAGDIGRRWREHVREWFLDPHEGLWIPISPDDFLSDPLAVFNNEALKQRLPDRQNTQRQILDVSWFVYSELHNIALGRCLEEVEYVLQEGLKRHIGIKVDGYIGDAGNRRPPTTALTIRNHFGRPFLAPTLPGKIVFEPGLGVRLP